MIDQIIQLQKKLKLSQSLLEFYKKIEFQSKDQFILELLQMLYDERYEKVIERNLKAARFTVLKTFDNYSFNGIEFPDTLSADALKALEFINNGENLILYGGVGSGKTHMCIALGLTAIKAGNKVYFYTVHDLINHLVEYFGVKEPLARTI